MQVWKFFHVRSSRVKIFFFGSLHCKSHGSWIPRKVQDNEVMETKVQDRTTIFIQSKQILQKKSHEILTFHSALPRSERRAGTSCLVYLVGTEPLIRYLFGWMALPVSAEVKTTGLLSKHFSSKCTENNVADFDGTKSFLWTLTNWVHFRKVSSFGK